MSVNLLLVPKKETTEMRLCVVLHEINKSVIRKRYVESNIHNSSRIKQYQNGRVLLVWPLVLWLFFLKPSRVGISQVEEN